MKNQQFKPLKQPEQTKEVTVDSKVTEVLQVALLFKIMNETRWNVFDDDFYLVNRRWFDAWKQYMAYDYILLKHVTELKKVSELSINQIIVNCNKHPGEIKNFDLVLGTN